MATPTSSLTTTALAFSVGATNNMTLTASQDKMTLSSQGGSGVLVENVATPLLPNDAANKAYVDNMGVGLSWKESVIVATNADGDITGITFQAGQSIDGITLAAGNRILIKNQTNGIENGIYIVQAGAPPVRADDLAVGSDAAAAAVFVQSGTLYADTAWVCSNDSSSAVVGTDSLVFVQFAGNALYTAGSGIDQTELDTNVIAVDNTVIRTTGGQTIAGTLDVTTTLTAGTLTDGTASMSAGTLTGLLTPTANSDAANKQYVDDQVDTLLPGGGLNSIQFNQGGNSFGGMSGWITTNGTTDFNGLDNSTLSLGDTGAFVISHDGTDTLGTSAQGNFIIDNTNATGFSVMRLGTDDSLTAFQVQNNSETPIMSMSGDGNMVVTSQIQAQTFTTQPGGASLTGTEVNGLTLPTDVDVDHAASVQYVLDKVSTPISFTDPVVSSPTIDIPSSPPTPPIAFIGGVNLTNGDRVLLRNQTNSVDNGIWIFNGATNQMTRAPAEGDGISAQNFVTFVSDGTEGGKSFIQTADPAIYGTDPLTYQLFSGATPAGGIPGEIQINEGGTFAGAQNFRIASSSATDMEVLSGSTLSFRNGSVETATTLSVDTGGTVFELNNPNPSSSAFKFINGGGEYMSIGVNNVNLPTDTALNLGSNGDFQISFASASGDTIFQSSNVSAQTIMRTGTSDPATSFRVEDSGSDLMFDVKGDKSAQFTGDVTLSSGTAATDKTTGSLVVSGGVGISGDCYATSFNTSSDATLKHNITMIEDPLEKLKKLEGYKYNFTADSESKTHWGVLAQQLKEIGMEHLVSGQEGHMTVNYIELIPLMIESIKELSRRSVQRPRRTV